MKDWHEHFLQLAELVAQRSKDPSTKTGAIIVDHNKRIVSTGYNGFPAAMEDAPELLANREEKYSRIIHCEMNALIFARRPLGGCALYTWPFICCDRCVVHMLQAGIAAFYAPKCPEHLKERWEPTFIKTRKYIKECGAELYEVSRES